MRLDDLPLILLRRFRPDEGWPIFLSMLLIVFCFISTMLAAEWVSGDERLSPLILCAFVLGRWLGRRGWSVRKSWSAALLLGLALAFNTGGRVLPSRAMLWQGLCGLTPWADIASAGSVRLNVFAQRLDHWLASFLQGQSSDDSGVFLFIAGTLAWLAIFCAAWGVFRGYHPLWAWLPAGALMAMSSYYASEAGLFYFIFFLAAMSTNLAWSATNQRRAAWEKAGIDYSDELFVDIGVSVSGVAVLLLALALISIVVFSPRMGEWMWRIIEKPATAFNSTLERLFAGANPKAGPGPGEAGQYGPGTSWVSGLPRSVLLGGSPELNETLVMWVHTDDPINAPTRRYWRAMAFDVYSGWGWDHSTTLAASAANPLDLRRAAPSPVYQPVWQHYELVMTTTHFFAVNTPLEVSVAAEAQWGDEDQNDLVALKGAASVYDVLSHTPTPNAAQLGSAGEQYPDWVLEKYLQLPDSVTARTRALAKEIAAGADTPYNVVKRLERYLRTYPYSLHVSAPPPGRDAVDVFLFEMGEGYCDYYASALVVMARSLGIPARLAIGYTVGEYYPERAAYRVSQAEAHSWVEVYFPQYGWIEFEPTAAQAVFSRGPVQDPAASQDEPPLPPPAAGQKVKKRGAAWRWLPLGALLLLGVWLYSRRRSRQALAALSTPALTLTLYARLGRWGERLGVAPRPGQTPREYGAALADCIAGQAARRKRGRAAWLERAQLAEGAVTQLVEAFVRVRYAPAGDESAEEHARLWQAWRRLDTNARLFWLVKRASFLARFDRVK